MNLPGHYHPSRFEAANAATLHRESRATDWILSIAFAALLGTAVWKLDNDDAAASPAAPATAASPTGDLVFDTVKTYFGRGDTTGGIGALQAQPEGWPWWNSGPAHPPLRYPHPEAKGPAVHPSCERT